MYEQRFGFLIIILQAIGETQAVLEEKSNLLSQSRVS